MIIDLNMEQKWKKYINNQDQPELTKQNYIDKQISMLKRKQRIQNLETKVKSCLKTEKNLGAKTERLNIDIPRKV